MANQSKKTGFPEFFADTQSADNLRRQFIDGPAEAAGQAALGAGLELANLFSILPAAFVASQERELERIKRVKVKDDPRVAALERSIEQAGVLQVTAQRGQVRLQRALVAVASQEKVFHGFVSDAELTPLKGLTVRVTGIEGARSKTLSATTDDDGYFSIPLGLKSAKSENFGVKTSAGSLLDRMANLTASFSKARSAAEEKSAEEEEGAQVEILKRGKVLHTDPAALTVDQGSVYREYVVDETAPSSASNLKNFAARVSAETTKSVTVAQSQGSAEASKGASTQAAAPAAARTKTAKKSKSAAKPKKSAPGK